MGAIEQWAAYRLITDTIGAGFILVSVLIVASIAVVDIFRSKRRPRRLPPKRMPGSTL